uniref:Uncharacterized protein n=3 Tax=Magallana gigas TaxID=29159 RepID=A0A8W8I633_MAGGI|nr:collagen alpha-1(III) chain [Crassostrea gigas]
MGQVRLTIVLFLGTFVHALVIEDPQNEQSLPAGFQRPTLKSSLDEPLGFGQISPFSGVPSPGAGNFPSGQGPLSGNFGNFPIGTGSASGIPGAGGNFAGFPVGTGSASGIPSGSVNFAGFPVGTGSASGIPSGSVNFAGFPVGTGSASGRQGVRGVPGGSGSFLSGTGSVNGIVPRSGTVGGFPTSNFDPLRGSFPIGSGQNPNLPFSSNRHNPLFERSPFSPLTPNLPGSSSQFPSSLGRSPNRPQVIFVPVPSQGHSHHHDPHHHDIPAKHDDPHHHDVPVKTPDPHHHDVPVGSHNPHHHDIPVKTPDPHHHDVPVGSHNPHHHDVPVGSHDPHHHDVPVGSRDPHHHDVPVGSHDPHHHDVPLDPFNIYSPSHKIGDLVPIGHGVPRIPPPPLNGPECQFSGCSIGRECVIAKTIVTESATLCPRAYSGRCVCVPGCVHHQKFIPQGYLKYEGRCSYCKCFPDGRVECKKSKACFAAKRRDREIHRQDREIHRHMDRPVRRNGRRRVGVFDLGGIVRSFLGRILG